MSNFKEIEKREDAVRWIRQEEKGHISVLHRLTGFGFWEWETAIVFYPEDKKPPYKHDEIELLLLGGDHREALNDMPVTEWRAFCQNNSENLTTMDSILKGLKE